jgi:hypothetical protein
MPFKSKAQEQYLAINHPKIAEKWRKEYPKQDISKLPEHVKSKDTTNSKNKPSTKK